MLTNLILEKHLSEKKREYEFLELPYLRKISREQEIEWLYTKRQISVKRSVSGY